jgi:hypothetical protein
MTLADEILGYDGPHVRPAAQFDEIKARIARTQKFCFDAAAVEAVINLLHSRPSSLIDAARRFARPPFDHTWIEYPSPDTTPLYPAQVRTTRIGVLIESMGPQAFSLTTAWSYDRRALIEAAEKVEPRLRAFLIQPPVAWSDMHAEVDFNGRFERMPLWEAPADPKEAGAMRDLEACIRFCDSTEVLRGVPRRTFDLSRFIDVAQEVKPAIGMLIMLNAKNCVTTQAIEPPARLNAARVRRGRMALVAHTIVGIRLGRRDGRQAETHGMSAAEVRQHLVRGHFKIRRTGVYWWRGHIRGGLVKGALVRSRYEVAG